MRKDWLILKRRSACAFSLLLLPPLFFYLATLQFTLLDHDVLEGPMINGNFYYSTNKAQTVLGSTVPDSYLKGSQDLPNPRLASLAPCYVSPNAAGRPYSKFAIISSDDTIKTEATTFFEKYVFQQSGLNAMFLVDAFKD